MTKEYLNMADVFTDDVKSDSDYLLNNELGEIANFSGYKKECRYAAHAINSHDELVAEVERLRELEADTMRYRKLRECHWNESPICVVVDPKQMVKLGADCPSTTRLDDAIDALIA